jgi:hypothetical protein
MISPYHLSRGEMRWINNADLEALHNRVAELEKTLRAVDGIEDALARYFADKDVPMDIRQAVDAFEIARAASGETPE